MATIRRSPTWVTVGPRERRESNLRMGFQGQVFRPAPVPSASPQPPTRRTTMKKLQIPPPLTNPCPEGMGFPASRMQSIIETPDQQHKVNAGGLMIDLFAKYTFSYTDLVLTAIASESARTLPVAFAFRAFADDYPTSLSEMPPLDVLKAFIAKYGLPVRLAGQTKLLHLPETITLTGPAPAQNLVEVVNLSRHQFIARQFFRLASPTQIDVGLVFAVDVTKYAESLAAHGLG
jgi:hypothetical protein